MGSIMFSAYFTFRSERVKFMTKVQEELGKATRLILFNLSETLDCDLEVVNAATGLQPSLADPVTALQQWLMAPSLPTNFWSAKLPVCSIRTTGESQARTKFRHFI